MNGDSGLRERLAAAFFVLFLVAQVVIPAVRLAGPRPVRFGWQMYSTLRPVGVFTLERADGTVDTVRIADHVARGRAEVDYGRALQRHLCAAVPDAAAVILERPGEPADRRPCR